MRLYWYGLGLNVPVLGLFTMASQHGRLKRGLPARYDEGEFQVCAPKLGTGRLSLALLSIVVLLVIHGSFKSDERRSTQAYRNGQTWTNDVTGRQVAIPRGWIYQTEKNRDKQTIHMFSGPDWGVSAIFASEDTDAGFDLESYANIWMDAVADTMALYLSTETLSVNGKPALVALGNMAQDKRRKVHTTLYKSGDRIWRFIVIGTDGHSPDQVDARRLGEALMSSVE